MRPTGVRNWSPQPVTDWLARKSGSPQEFVSNGILRGFLDVLKSDIFGIGNGHAASLQ